MSMKVTGQAMALTRSVFFYSPLHRATLLNRPKPNFIFPNSTHKTNRPLVHHSQISCPLCLSVATSSSSSMDAPPEGYRRNVGICLINPSKKIFAASRLDKPGSWQMPQGGIDENEDPKTAAIRELREETGISSAEVIAEAPCWLTYDFPPGIRENLRIKWGGDWKGQAQKWFLLKFTGKEEGINLLGDGSEKPEFGEWSWMSPNELTEHVVDFKKPVYKEVFSVFAPYLQ